jgi:O-antigen/teichoic acid export membrane protein
MVYITFTYLSSVFFQWITSSSWRYYLKYKNSDQKTIYYQVIVLLYFVSILFLFIISTIWYLFTSDVFQKKLILLGFVFASSQEFINTILVPMRMKYSARKYNLINAGRSVVSFLLLLLLTFIFNFQIEAFFIAPVMVNLATLVIPLLLLKSKLTEVFICRISLAYPHIKRFFLYGMTTFIYNTCMFLLISSDRYIILMFNGYDKVGIYNQTYNIAQIGIAALFSAINAAFNPVLLSNLDSKPNQSDGILLNALYFTTYICLPLTFIPCFYSGEITQLLLGPDFREAYNILPVIFFSAFMGGISHYPSLKLKFKNTYKQLIIASLVAAFLNIALTFICVPLLGYKSAAYTTIIAYVFLAIYLFVKAGWKLLEHMEIWNKLFKIIGMLFSFLIIHIVIKNYVSAQFFHSIVYSVLEGIIFLMTYLLLSKNISPLKNNRLINEFK